MRRFRINCTLLTLSLAVFMANPAVAEQFYMFKDKNGQTQIQDSIPAEYAKNGYKIVNGRGVTIKVIPSEDEQRQHLEASEQRKNQISLLEKQKAEKRQWDERLFRSFSSAEDIRQAGNKKIMAVQMQIETTARHIIAFENNLAKLDAQRAAGGHADEESIAKLKESIKLNNAFIIEKRQEQNKIREEYLGYVRRYQMLSI